MALAHICGYAGSGKSNLGRELQELYGARLCVVELDDFLLSDYYEPTDLRRHLETEVARVVSSSSVPVILVGTGCNVPSLEEFAVLPAKHHLWLDVDLDTSCTQALKRQFDFVTTHRDEVVKMLTSMSREKSNTYLETYYNYQARREMWGPLRELCVDGYGYQPLSREEILNVVASEVVPSREGLPVLGN